MRTFVHILFTASVLGVVMGCGGADSARDSQTAADQSPEARAARGQMLEYHKPDQERDFYTTRSARTQPGSSMEVALRADVTAMRPLRPDGNLDAFARWVLREIGHKREPNGSSNAFAAFWLGLPDTNLVLTTFGGNSLAACKKSLQTQAVDVLRVSRSFTHYGIAEDCTESGYGALVLSARHADLSDVPIETDAASTSVQVSLHEGWSNGELVVTSPTGETQNLPIAGRRGRVTIALPRPGRYQLEVIAVGKHGPALLYNFPIFAGIERPERWLEAPEINHAPRSAEEVEAQLHTMVNRERARRGLAPLSRDARIDAVARSHSREMMELERVAHHSPTTGTHHDRLVAAGMDWPISVENLARARNGFSACQGLMDSPAHRAGILDPNVTHVGVGGVMDRTGETVFLTWVAVGEPNVELDELLENARDHVRRTTGASRSEFLDRLAKAFIDRYIQSAQPMEVVWKSTPRAQKAIAQRYQALHPHLFMKNTNTMEPGDFAAIAKGQDYGLAAAISQRTDDPKGSIRLMVIFGQPR